MITRVNLRTDALCSTCRSNKWKAADKFLRQVDTGKATPPADWEQTNCHSCGRQVWRHPNRKSPRALCHTCADLGSRRHRDAVRATEIQPLLKPTEWGPWPPSGLAIVNDPREWAQIGD
jgi:hypothetical protein